MILILKSTNKDLYRLTKRLVVNSTKIKKLRKFEADHWNSTSLEKVQHKHKLQELLDERKQLLKSIEQF